MSETTDKSKDSSDGAVEVLFEDFYKKKWRVYRMNFIRGVFFGIGSVVGGTVVIAGFIWVLSLLVDLPGGAGNFVQYIVDQVQNR